MTPISPAHTREDLIDMIHQRDELVSDLKEVVEARNKTIAGLNGDRIQPSLSFHERMQRADNSVRESYELRTAAEAKLSDALCLLREYAVSDIYGARAREFLKDYPPLQHS